MKKLAVLVSIFLAVISNAESQTYNDVLVIVNSNSAISQNVGQYFKAQRGIPSVNICSMAMATTEEIDSATFAGYVSQIKTYMTSNSLTSSINYIVTTQGVPLKVRRSSSVFDPNSNASSFDSDLCLMNSGLEGRIGKAGFELNPYLYSTSNFSRSAPFSNIVLVTRLAGYSYTDIVGLIDRAKQPYHSAGKFVFDEDPARVGNILNVRMEIAKDTLVKRGFNVLLNTTSEYVVNQTAVLGYVSWGSNDTYWSSYTQKAQPHFDWSAKALAETYVSSSGRSFEDSSFVEPTIGWQSMVADLIHENGVTGVKGYVFEPYTTAMSRVNYLFDRWTNGYNLAESFYASSYCLGWMDVVIGDPKSRFAADGHLPVELLSFSGMLTHEHTVTLVWNTATEINNYGFEIEKRLENDWETIGFVEGHGTSSVKNSYQFEDQFAGAENVYRLKQIDRDGDVSYSEAIRVLGARSDGYALQQNYPNPFNPSTSIGFTVPEVTRISLKIYSMSGREVATLTDGESFTPGSHSISWNGITNAGMTAPAGFYVYLLTGTRDGIVVFTASRQMCIVK